MKKINLAILTLLVALTACKKVPEVNLKYVDVERDLITVGTTTATVQCDYQYIATLKNAYFYYGEGQNEADMNTAEMRVVQNTLYVDLAGLKENTAYSYYYEFYNGFNSMRTEAKTFKTETSPIVVTLPTVITVEVTEITENSAQCGGEVTNDGGAEVTERGICWGMNANPTLSDNHVAAGSGLGEFTALMDSLQNNTIYHVRAYANNEAGTAYGLDKEFATISGGGGGGNGDVPTGAINGLFTINENGDQVYFSQGNLQYQASTNTWRFAENQWDFVGGNNWYFDYGNVYENGVKCNNNEISSTYSGWIDLFGWGTSGYNHGATCYEPWSTSSNYYDYYAYGSWNVNLNDQTGIADWGYNAISNGGNMENQWRTLTNEEWWYVVSKREGVSYAKAIVNDVKGVILLPDGWNLSTFQLNDTNTSAAPFSTNAISVEDWTNGLESNGAIFLPAASYRIEDYLYYVGTDMDGSGNYWSASFGTGEHAYGPGFDSSCFVPVTYQHGRHNGLSVRLVHDAQ